MSYLLGFWMRFDGKVRRFVFVKENHGNDLHFKGMLLLHKHPTSTSSARSVSFQRACSNNRLCQALNGGVYLFGHYRGYIARLCLILGADLMKPTQTQRRELCKSPNTT